MSRYTKLDTGSFDGPGRSTNERDRQGGSRLDRRGYLRLLGASAGVATIGALETDTAGASSYYTTYTVSAGETFTRMIGSDETFENALIDVTADGASIDVTAQGSNWGIHNIGVKGRCTTNDGNSFRLEVDEGSTGVFENVYLGDGAAPSHCTGVFVPTTHAGTLRIRALNVQYWPGNGVYASAPGRSERGGRGGLVEIERSYARNNNIAGFRLGTDGSIVRDSVVVVDDDIPDLTPSGMEEARGVWVKEGASVRIERCDVLLANPDGMYCVWEGDDNSVGLARVIDSEVAARNGADGKYTGNVETMNVGSEPTIEQPPSVPTSAREAALGRNLPKSIDIAGGSNSDELEYVVETTGEVAGTRSTEPGDAVSNGRVSGTSIGGSDIYRYSGTITTLDVSLPGDDSIASIAVDRQADRIAFDCGSRNTDPLEYYLRVTGSLEPSSSIDDKDVSSGTEAKGIVLDGGTDAYDYTGDVAALRVKLGSEQLSIGIETTD